MRHSKGARLYYQGDEYRDGKLNRRGVWVIRDRSRKISTGCARDARAEAERKLSEYIASKYQPPKADKRHPSQILVADVLLLYVDKVVEKKHANPVETKSRIAKLIEFFQGDYLSAINGEHCREYVEWRIKQPRKACKPDKTGNAPLMVTETTARRELEDFRSAINYHRKQGHCSEFVGVALPDKAEARDVWLKRDQMAKLLMAAWRAKQTTSDGKATDRDTGKHIARFILIGRYTGSRSGAICGASLVPAIGRGHVDLEEGIFKRRAQGAKETNKRQPTIRLPDRLLAHMRRWERLGLSQHAVVEWHGAPIKSVRKGFAAACKAAGLPTSGPDKVTPHTLRHTAATWGMQHVKTTSDVWELAGFLGMSFEMLMERYGHHCPNFQSGAAAAITGKPRRSPGQKPDRLTVNKRAQTS